MDINDYMGKITGILTELYEFASTMKNVHKQIKEWSRDLKKTVDKVHVISEKCSAYAEIAGGRIEDLSNSYLDLSSPLAALPFTKELHSQIEEEQVVTMSGSTTRPEKKPPKAPWTRCPSLQPKT